MGCHEEHIVFVSVVLQPLPRRNSLICQDPDYRFREDQVAYTSYLVYGSNQGPSGIRARISEPAPTPRSVRVLLLGPVHTKLCIQRE